MREQASLLRRVNAPGTNPILRTALLEAHVGEKLAPLHFMPHKLPPGARDWLAVGIVDAEKKLLETILAKARAGNEAGPVKPNEPRA